MRQFTITHLLMATWLIAILMGMAIWNGWGRSFQKVSDLAFSPDGKRLVVVQNSARNANVPGKVYLADVSRTISVLDTASGRTERIIERAMHEGQGGGRRLYYDLQKIVAFGPDGTVLLVQEFGGETVKTYDFGAGRRQGRSQKFAQDSGLFFAVTPDGRHGIASTLNGMFSWDVTAGRTKVLTDRSPEGPQDFDLPLVAISPDGSLIAVVTHSAVELRKAVDWSLVACVDKLTTGDEMIQTVAFSPNGRLLAVGGRGKLTLHDLRRRQSRQVDIDNYVTKVAFSPDSKTVAFSDGKYGDLLDVASGRKIRDLECAGGVTSLEYSPDGATLAIGDWTGHVSLWNPVTGQMAWTVKAPTTPEDLSVYFFAALALWAIVCYAIWEIRRRRGAAVASIFVIEPRSGGSQ